MKVIKSRGSLMLNLALQGKTVNANRVRRSSKYIPVNKKFTQDEENQLPDLYNKELESMQIQASSTANRNCLQEKTSEAEYHNQKGVSIEFVGCDENDLQAIAITDITFSNVNETNDITFEVDDLFNDNIEPNARSESENITMEFDIANNIEIENIDESLANETDTDYVPLVEYSSTDSDVEPTENKTNESRKRSRSQRGKDVTHLTREHPFKSTFISERYDSQQPKL
uniref:Uncharacterized protein LOC114341165 n=1 Tax=Diabrotica virgifera virgifera TaxID=50390 RepID=A0A6P7GE05_DIAVI